MGKFVHRAVLLKIFVLFRASSDEVRMEGPCKFLYLGEVILVLGPGLVFPGVEEEVACKHLVDHTSEGPDVCSLVIGLSEDHLWRTILPSLYLSRKMMVLPAGIAQVSYLYPQRRLQLLSSAETYLPLLHIEQLLQTLPSLALPLLVLFLSLPQHLLLQSLLLLFTQVVALQLLLQLSQLRWPIWPHTDS